MVEGGGGETGVGEAWEVALRMMVGAGLTCMYMDLSGQDTAFLH